MGWGMFDGIDEAMSRLEMVDQMLPLLQRIAEGVDRLVQLEEKRQEAEYNDNL
jgi:hypothetical protein